jgi:50S ribosomal protein L16 3-hydroxylase
MVKQVAEHFSGLSNQAAIAQSLAKSLSEPAATAVFEAPPRPDNLSRFLKKSGQFGLRLACATRLLYRGRDFFMNGEPLPLAGTEGSRKTPAGPGKKSQNAQDFLKELSDFRQLNGKACVNFPPALQDVLYNVYRAGWIVYNLRVN